MSAVQNPMVPGVDEAFEGNFLDHMSSRSAEGGREVEEVSPDSTVPRRLHESIRRAPRRAQRGWVHREIRRLLRRSAD